MSFKVGDVLFIHDKIAYFKGPGKLIQIIDDGDLKEYPYRYILKKEHIGFANMKTLTDYCRIATKADLVLYGD